MLQCHFSRLVKPGMGGIYRSLMKEQLAPTRVDSPDSNPPSLPY